MELLDGVCDSMKDYELKSIATDLTDQAEAWQWIHPKHTQHRPLQDNTTDKAQLKQQQRRLQNYCAQLLDKYEEQMSAALQQGSSAEGDSAALVCASIACYLSLPLCTLHLQMVRGLEVYAKQQVCVLMQI